MEILNLGVAEIILLMLIIAAAIATVAYINGEVPHYGASGSEANTEGISDCATGMVEASLGAQGLNVAQHHRSLDSYAVHIRNA